MKLDIEIKNKNIIKTSSCIINNTSSYNFKKYISNNKYSSIIYLLLKKQFTYFSEIRRLFNITTNGYLNNLKDEGIIIERYPTIEEKEYLKTLYKKMSNDTLNTIKFVELSENALDFYSNPQVYDVLRIFAKDGIDNYIILQKNTYEQLKIKEKIDFNKKLLEAGIQIEDKELKNKEIAKQAIEEMMKDE